MRTVIIYAVLFLSLIANTFYLEGRKDAYRESLELSQHNSGLLLSWVVEQTAMTARDDKLLNFLLDNSWDRDCGYEVEPWILLADGSMRQSLNQICDP